MQKKVLGFAIASLFFGGVAGADPAPKDTGLFVTAGGGVEDFVGHGMRHASNANGMWGIHTGMEVQKYVTFEAGYLGSAGKVNAPLGNSSATLIGTTFEGIARATPFPDSKVKPYAFFGAAWRHYGISGADFTTADSGMNDSSDLLQMPVGAGVAYEQGKFIADARFTFRPSVDVNQKLLEATGGSYGDTTADTWGLGANLGLKF